MSTNASRSREPVSSTAMETHAVSSGTSPARHAAALPDLRRAAAEQLEEGTQTAHGPPRGEGVSRGTRYVSAGPPASSCPDCPRRSTSPARRSSPPARPSGRRRARRCRRPRAGWWRPPGRSRRTARRSPRSASAPAAGAAASRRHAAVSGARWSGPRTPGPGRSPHHDLVHGRQEQRLPVQPDRRPRRRRGDGRSAGRTRRAAPPRPRSTPSTDSRIWVTDRDVEVGVEGPAGAVGAADERVEEARSGRRRSAAGRCPAGDRRRRGTRAHHRHALVERRGHLDEPCRPSRCSSSVLDDRPPSAAARSRSRRSGARSASPRDVRDDEQLDGAVAAAGRAAPGPGHLRATPRW